MERSPSSSSLASSHTSLDSTDGPAPSAHLPNIALVIGSTRQPRVGPSLASTIYASIQADPAARGLANFSVLDISSFALPMFDEPGVPKKIRSVDGYVHEHTRVWSRAVSRLDGFVFLTPQYNGSVPASLKNALDFLHHEWQRKPALILSYGGRGGNEGNRHLRDITRHMGFRAMDDTAMFVMGPVKDAMRQAEKGHLVDDVESVFADQFEKTRALYVKLAEMTATSKREREEEEAEKTATAKTTMTTTVTAMPKTAVLA